MSRVDENKDIIIHFAEEAIKTGSGTYEEMVSWQLGTMNAFLVDISKSLAVIADKMAQEVDE